MRLTGKLYPSTRGQRRNLLLLPPTIAIEVDYLGSEEAPEVVAAMTVIEMIGLAAMIMNPEKITSHMRAILAEKRAIKHRTVGIIK